MYTRLPADIPYGERDRQGYSSYVPAASAYAYYPSFYYPYPARTSYSYAPAVTHAYGNVDQSVGTPYMYTRLPADIPYGERDRQGYSSYVPAVSGYAYYPSLYYPSAYSYPARKSYSYVPAVTHAYGNVDQSVGTPYMYTRLPADIPYGERERQGYSSYVPAVSAYAYYPNFYYPYPVGTSYSYAPAVTHAYGNVDLSVGTPYMYTRLPADILYGERAMPFMYTRV